MGEQISNQINIYVESGDAQKQLDALVAKNKSLQTATDELRAKQAQADMERKAGNAAAEASYKSLTEQIRDNQAKIDANTAAMDRQSKKVSGELSASIKDLEAGIRRLTLAQKLSSEQDPGYKERAKELDEFRSALDRVKTSSGLLAEKMKEEKEHGLGLKEVLTGVAGGVGLVTTAEAGLEKGIELTKESVKLELDREKGLKRLEVAIDNWGNKSEGALERFNVKSEETAKKFGYLLPAEITEVQQKLVTFGRLSEEQINQLLPVIINFSAQTGKSMEESSQNILSAFEGNGRAMKQYGIELKKDEGFAVNYGIVMDQLAAKVDGAGEAFAKSDAGQLATYSKNIEELKEDIGKGLIPILVEMSKGGIAAVNALRELPHFVSENRKTIIALVGAYALYNSALIASTLRTGYNTVATGINSAIKWASAAANGALSLSYMVLTGEISLATAATRAYQVVAAAAGGPIGIVVGALIAAGTALAAYASELNNTQKIERSVGEARQEAAKSVVKEKLELEQLVATAKNEHTTKEQKLKAIQRLNEISPEYLGNITAENIGTNKGTEAINKYIESLDRKAFAEAINAKLVDLNKQKIDAMNKPMGEIITITNTLTNGLTTSAKMQEFANEKRREGVKAIDEQITALTKLSLAQNENKELSPEESKAKDLKAIQQFFADATTARHEFDNLNAQSEESEVNRVQEHIHALNDKLEEYRHDGLITLSQYYEAKKLLEKNDAYQELVDAAKRNEEAAKKAQEQHKKRLEDFKKLQEELYTQSELARNMNLNAHDKELADLAVKYQKEEKDLKAFLDDKTITEQEYNKALIQIKKNHSEEGKAIDTKYDKEGKSKQYEEDLKAQQVLFAKVKQLQLDRLNEGLITQEEYDRRIGQLEVAEFEYKSALARKYKGVVEKAADDEVKADQDAKTQKSKNTQEEIKRQQANLDYIKKKQKDTLKATNDDYDNTLAAKLEIIKENYVKEYKQHKDNADAVKSLNAATAAEIQKAYEDSMKKTLKTISEDIEKVGSFAMSIANSIAQIQDNKANAEIARDKKANAQMVKDYENKVSKKQMTREQADKLEQQAAEAMAKKDDDLKRKQFERDKKMKEAQAAINMAVGIMNAFATAPNFIVGAVEAALVLAAGIAQEVAIASQTYTSMADGGEIMGVKHSHSSGGNLVIDGGTGRVIHKVEAGEHVLPADTSKNNPEVIQMLKSQGRSRNIKDMLAPASAVNSERAIDTIHQAHNGYSSSALPSGRSSDSSSSSMDTSKMEKLLAENNSLHKEHIAVSKQIHAKPGITIHDIHQNERTEQVMISQQL